MAVPKRKTTPSRRGMRRAHDALKKINVIVDKDTGEYRLPHHIDLSNGSYNNKKILVAKEEKVEG